MDVPLTPLVVDVVTFDRAPLGRRGYHEAQVDDFLDRVQATLAGEDTLTAKDVREVEFDAAPFIRRGYHEDQVDAFLDLVVEELERREAESPAAPHRLPGPGPHPGVPASPPPGTELPSATRSISHPGTLAVSTPSGIAPGAPAPNTRSIRHPAAPPASTPAPSAAPEPHSPTPPSATPPPGTQSVRHPSTPPADNPASGAGTPAPGSPTPDTQSVRHPAAPASDANTPGTPSPGTQSIRHPSTPPTDNPTSGATTPGTQTIGHPGTPAASTPSGSAPGTPPPGTQSIRHPGAPPADPSTPGTHSGRHPGAPNTTGNNVAQQPAVDPSTPVAWVPFPTTPRQVPPPTPAETTNPMLFVVPPSHESPSTQPLTKAASDPPKSSVPAATDETGPADQAKPDESPTRAVDPSVAAGQAASALRAGVEEEPIPVRTLADYAPKPSEHAAPVAEEPAGDPPAFPFPPAPPGEPGYAPTDVARLAKLLAHAPDREQLAKLTFGVTTSGGYHTGTIDALRQAWLDALATKRP